jgi:hypothetical protein
LIPKFPIFLIQNFRTLIFLVSKTDHLPVAYC